MTKTLVIDPPGGWQYGFPKAVPAGIMKSDSLLRLWLTDQGYPIDDVDLAIKHSRYWETEDEQDTNL
jgi:hypothetical protein